MFDGITMTVEDALKTLHKEPWNAAAWEVIASSQYHPLLAYVASLLVTFKVAPGETANDIVQDVFLRFYERWPKIAYKTASLSDLRAYLRTSCRNLLVDRFRHQRNVDQFVDFLDLNFSRAFQGESDLYRSIFLDEIIKKLPGPCAELFKQYVSEDLSPAEIADRLGEPPATFYSRWYRCIQKSKEIFLQKKGGPKRF